MIIGSFNIRGGGIFVKRKRIAHIIDKGKAVVFLIQETKMASLSQDLARSFWYKEEIDNTVSNYVGLSGGMFIMWKNSEFDVIYSFRGVGYLGIKLSWKNHLYYIINVYSGCSGEEKRLLCNCFQELKLKFMDGEWLIGGNFNAIKNRRERVGKSAQVTSAEWRDFAAFIDGMNLIDVPCKGKKYSWFCGDGCSKSRLDCFLISDSIINQWGW